MGPGSLFTCFGSVPLTRCKRGDQGETSTPCLPRPGTPGAKPEQRIDPNDAGHQRQRRETLVSAKALPRRSGPGNLRSVSPVPGAGSVPRRLFGPFLDVQKGTRPAGRAPPALEKGQAIVVHLHLPSAPTGQLQLNLSGSAAFPLP